MSSFDGAAGKDVYDDVEKIIAGSMNFTFFCLLFSIKLIQNYTFSVGISLPQIYSILISFSFSFPPSYSCAILHIWLEYCQSMRFLSMVVVNSTY